MNINDTLEELLPGVEEQVFTEKELLHDLLIYNDDVNTFHWVIETLIEVCGHEPLQAEQCTYIIHHNGKCSVKQGTFDDLKPLCIQLLDRKLSAVIE